MAVERKSILDAPPGLRAAHEAFAHARSTSGPGEWQMHYHRGACADGTAGPDDHKVKLRLRSP